MNTPSKHWGVGSQMLQWLLNLIWGCSHKWETIEVRSLDSHREVLIGLSVYLKCKKMR